MAYLPRTPLDNKNMLELVSSYSNVESTAFNIIHSNWPETMEISQKFSKYAQIALNSGFRCFEYNNKFYIQVDRKSDIDKLYTLGLICKDTVLICDNLESMHMSALLRYNIETAGLLFRMHRPFNLDYYEILSQYEHFEDSTVKFIPDVERIKAYIRSSQLTALNPVNAAIRESSSLVSIAYTDGKEHAAYIGMAGGGIEISCTNDTFLRLNFDTADICDSSKIYRIDLTRVESKPTLKCMNIDEFMYKLIEQKARLKIAVDSINAFKVILKHLWRFIYWDFNNHKLSKGSLTFRDVDISVNAEARDIQKAMNTVNKAMIKNYETYLGIRKKEK